MLKLTRISFIALLLLLALFSLPFWLPGLQAVGEGRAESPNAGADESAGLHSKGQAPEADLSGPDLATFELSAVTLLDAGWVTGSTMQQVVHPPAIVRWDPVQDEVAWRLETGDSNGAYIDEEGGRLYLMERFNLQQARLAGLTPFEGEGSSASGWYHYLTILDAESGEVISRTELIDMPILGANAGQLFPIARRGSRLYLRNYAQYGLYVYDLERGAFVDERWKLCESGYPFDSAHLPDENAFVTFCMNFSTGMQAGLTRLSIDKGTSTSVEIPQLGSADYMTGNGFVVGPGHLAYVVDSDAGALVELDLDTMQILRQAKYRQYRPGGGESSWLQSAVSWLLDLAASPARAKRWMSQPAVSPDGHYLAVDGGFGAGGGDTRDTTSVWLIDLGSLKAVNEIELPGSPQALHFAGDSQLYILLQTELPGTSQAVVFDLESQQSLTLDLPISGRVLQFLP